MNHGQIECESTEIGEVITAFLSHYDSPTQKSGTGESRFEDCSLAELNSDGTKRKVTELRQGSKGTIEATLVTEVAVTVHCQIDTTMLTPLISLNKIDDEGSLRIYPPGSHKITINLGNIDLNAGKYSVVLAAATSETEQVACRHQGAVELTVTSDSVAWCPIVRNG